MATVSVIVPAYNAEATILETIQSIQNQTFADFELIVINDGSTDNTLTLLGQVEDSRLQVFTYPNGGLPVARNRGIHHATGEFISFVDADDLWTPDKLELQLQALQQHPAAGVAYSWTAFIDGQGNFLYAREPLAFTGNVYPQLLVDNFISNGSNILLRRELVAEAGIFDPSLKSAEDWDFYIRLAARSEFAVVPKYQILYRKSTQSMTSKVPVMETNILKVVEKAFASAPPELQNLRRKALANNYRFFAKLYLEHASSQQDIEQGWHRLRTGIRLDQKSLGDRETQSLIVKLLLARLLPLGFTHRVTPLLRRFFARVRVSAGEFSHSGL
jgi:glycosyltransferase involved in cell wall biosynthesis